MNGSIQRKANGRLTLVLCWLEFLVLLRVVHRNLAVRDLVNFHLLAPVLWEVLIRELGTRWCLFAGEGGEMEGWRLVRVCSNFTGRWRKLGVMGKEKEHWWPKGGFGWKTEKEKGLKGGLKMKMAKWVW